MSYRITTIPIFEKQYSRLVKKYLSLSDDMIALIDSLKQNPSQGSPLGGDMYKVRMAIRAKAKGKSGGARVITCVKIVNEEIILCAIYDKSEQETIDLKDIKKALLLIS